MHLSEDDVDLIVKFNLSEAFSKFPSLTRNFHNSSLTMLARSLFFCLVFFILSSKLMKLVWQYFTDHIHFIISSLCDMWGDLLPGAQWYNHPGDGITLQSVFSGSIWGWSDQSGSIVWISKAVNHRQAAAWCHSCCHCDLFPPKPATDWAQWVSPISEGRCAPESRETGLGTTLTHAELY